jgi:hypothetical protein
VVSFVAQVFLWALFTIAMVLTVSYVLWLMFGRGSHTIP